MPGMLEMRRRPAIRNAAEFPFNPIAFNGQSIQTRTIKSPSKYLSQCAMKNHSDSKVTHEINTSRHERKSVLMPLIAGFACFQPLPCLHTVHQWAGKMRSCRAGTRQLSASSILALLFKQRIKNVFCLSNMGRHNMCI